MPKAKSNIQRLNQVIRFKATPNTLALARHMARSRKTNVSELCRNALIFYLHHSNEEAGNIVQP